MFLNILIINLIGNFLYTMSCFSVATFKTLCLCLTVDYDVSRCESLSFSYLELIQLFFFFFSFLGYTCGIWKFSGWGQIGAAAGTYTTATATKDPSCICDLHCSLWQRWILKPLREARDRTCILMDTSQVLNVLSHNRNSCCVFNPSKSSFTHRYHILFVYLIACNTRCNGIYKCFISTGWTDLNKPQFWGLHVTALAILPLRKKKSDR